MFVSFTIENYRCFDDFTINPLKSVNLIAGPNNIGKTTLLEALWVLQGPFGAGMWFRPNLLRHIPVTDLKRPGHNLFNNFKTQNEILVSGLTEDKRILSYKLRTKPHELVRYSKSDTISSRIENEGLSTTESSYVLEVEYYDELDGEPLKADIKLTVDKNKQIMAEYDPRFKSRKDLPLSIFTSDTIIEDQNVIAERFGKLEVSNRTDVVIEGLKIIEPDLKKLSVIVKSGMPVIHGYVGLDRPLPLKLLGGGMNQIFKYVVNIGCAHGGLVLIDEFENGIHHSVLSKVWQVVAKIAKEVNCQVIATTHSMECIKAAHQAFCKEKSSENFAFHRLFRDYEKISSTYYDCEALEGALDLGFDLR